MNKPHVTVLVPAVDEEKLIGKLVKDILKIKKYSFQILVIIDDKTHDNTKDVAEKAGAQVIHIGKGLGKGTAIRKSIEHIKFPYVVQIDSDHQFQPFEIPLLVEPLLKGHDVTLGTRYQKGAHVEKGSVSIIKLLGSYFLSGAASVVAKKRITDVMAGFKGFRTKVLKNLPLTTDHFGYEAELAISAAQKNYKILNVPITYTARNIGNSNVNSIKHGLLVLQTIIKTGFKQK